MEKLQNSDLWVYYINPDKFIHRKKSIEDTINKIGCKDSLRIVNNISFDDRAMSINLSHKITIETIIKNNHFPTLILEDDAELLQPFPTEIFIDDAATIIYFGGSNYDSGQTPKMYIENYNDLYFRVYYMLSAHSYMITNKKSAEKIIKMLEMATSSKRFNDVTIANFSKNNIYLVPKDGNYFYQNDYTSSVTKFFWKNYK